MWPAGAWSRLLRPDKASDHVFNGHRYCNRPAARKVDAHAPSLNFGDVYDAGGIDRDPLLALNQEDWI
jgi:hypothetical protein